MLRVSPEGTTLGRSSENTFHFHDITISRRHAVFRIDSRGSVSMVDEGSTNGTFVNGQRVEAQRVIRLEQGDRIQLGTGVLMKLVHLDPSDERFQHEMFERTVRDGLTGLYNRAYFLNQVGGLATRHEAQGIGLAVLMMDVDHFKRVNDRYGHLAGDRVLREVALVIRESTRAEDLVARYGGEEFVVALPVSAPDLATERAERIRSNVESRTILSGMDEIQVTISVGLAFVSYGRLRDETALIEAADRALYQAKADGRNRVVLGRHLHPIEYPKTESAEFLTSL
jgi:diguanylate cyclase (GGDEF)-like protein